MCGFNVVKQSIVIIATIVAHFAFNFNCIFRLLSGMICFNLASDQLVKCDKCEFECSSMQKLKRHGNDKHENLWFGCDMCDFIGKTKAQIRKLESGMCLQLVINVIL